jgi:hypothetical protein
MSLLRERQIEQSAFILSIIELSCRHLRLKHIREQPRKSPRQRIRIAIEHLLIHPKKILCPFPSLTKETSQKSSANLKISLHQKEPHSFSA